MRKNLILLYLVSVMFLMIIGMGCEEQIVTPVNGMHTWRYRYVDFSYVRATGLMTLKNPTSLRVDVWIKRYYWCASQDSVLANCTVIKAGEFVEIPSGELLEGKPGGDILRNSNEENCWSPGVFVRLGPFASHHYTEFYEHGEVIRIVVNRDGCLTETDIKLD